MKRLIAAMTICGTLAACGVDGEPEKPTVSGAVTISNNGVYPSVGVSKGPVSIFVGL